MKPLQISLWDGYVMGGGVGISQFSTIRVATEKTLWSMPENVIGFFPDVGASYFLPRVKSNPCLGMYLGLLGHKLRGKELIQWELATHYIPSEKLDDLKKEISE
jgi:enoyl-CoA hydratase/carnithine racemase